MANRTHYKLERTEEHHFGQTACGKSLDWSQIPINFDGTQTIPVTTDVEVYVTCRACRTRMGWPDRRRY